jgi:hypothetical protein
MNTKQHKIEITACYPGQSEFDVTEDMLVAYKKGNKTVGGIKTGETDCYIELDIIDSWMTFSGDNWSLYYFELV